MTKLLAVLVAAASLTATPALAACPAGQSALLTARLYFGQVADGKPIAPAAWRDFVARAVTPRFPSGFTVYDAQGQWREPRTRAVQREPSKVIEIAQEDTPAFRARIAELRGIYSARFHQQSVGMLMLPACGAF